MEFLADGEVLRGIRCVEMELGEPDASGRRRPVPVEGSEFVLEAQAALLAVGQTIDTACLDGSKIDLERNGAIVVDQATGRTSRPKVFAGGDVVTRAWGSPSRRLAPDIDLRTPSIVSFKVSRSSRPGPIPTSNRASPATTSETPPPRHASGPRHAPRMNGSPTSPSTSRD